MPSNRVREKIQCMLVYGPATWLEKNSTSFSAAKTRRTNGRKNTVSDQTDTEIDGQAERQTKRQTVVQTDEKTAREPS